MGGSGASDLRLDGTKGKLGANANGLLPPHIPLPRLIRAKASNSEMMLASVEPEAMVTMKIRFAGWSGIRLSAKVNAGCSCLKVCFITAEGTNGPWVTAVFPLVEHD
jgi:hypothetical protein